jgi:hypothetical protein
MKRLLATPRRVFAVGALAAVAVVVAAGFGYAAVATDNQTYTGCLQSGSLSNIAIGSAPLKACPKNATEISWSQTGPPGTPGTNGTNGTNGTDGVSVASAPEAAGANCADGGSKFTAANGVTYACNGAKGDKGEKGDPGGSSLAALDGSPCTTYTGEASTVGVTVTQSGTVSITCIARADVSVTFSGGSMDGIHIEDVTVAALSVDCLHVSECSARLPKGHQLSVTFEAPFNKNFEYTCPGESPRLATASFINPQLGTLYHGFCQPANPFHTLEGDYIITGSFLDS